MFESSRHKARFSQSVPLSEDVANRVQDPVEIDGPNNLASPEALKVSALRRRPVERPRRSTRAFESSTGIGVVRAADNDTKAHKFKAHGASRAAVSMHGAAPHGAERKSLSTHCVSKKQ